MSFATTTFQFPIQFGSTPRRRHGRRERAESRSPWSVAGQSTVGAWPRLQRSRDARCAPSASNRQPRTAHYQDSSRVNATTTSEQQLLYRRIQTQGRLGSKHSGRCRRDSRSSRQWPLLSSADHVGTAPRVRAIRDARPKGLCPRPPPSIPPKVLRCFGCGTCPTAACARRTESEGLLDQNGVKRWVMSPEVLEALGRTWADVRSFPTGRSTRCRTVRTRSLPPGSRLAADSRAIRMPH